MNNQERNNMDIPKEDDISVYDSLDERKAVDHFLGRSIEQAEQLFIENSMMYQEDLMWMGPKAFRYYLESVLKYSQNPLSRGDDDFVFALVSTFEFRRDGELLDADEPKVTTIVEYILSNCSKFELTGEAFRPVRQRLTSLKTNNFQDCVDLCNSGQPDDLIVAAKSLAKLGSSDHPGLEKIYSLLLDADKKCPGVADTYWLEYYDSTIAGDSLTIDWMFKTLEQRGHGQPLAIELAGNDLEFHLHEAIDGRADDLIRAIESGLINVVVMALEHWTNPAFSPKEFPLDRHKDILRSLRRSSHLEIRAVIDDFSKFPSRISK